MELLCVKFLLKRLYIVWRWSVSWLFMTLLGVKVKVF